MEKEKISAIKNSEIYQSALSFATEKHSGQFRKGSNQPYVIHPIATTDIVLKYGEGDINLMIVCAMLHDTIEDTQTSFEEIVSLFGKTAAKGVLALSKNSNLPKEQQLSDSLNRILQQPNEIAQIKIADRINNFADIPPTWSAEKVQSCYHDGVQIYEKLSNRCPDALTQLFKQTLDDYKKNAFTNFNK